MSLNELKRLAVSLEDSLNYVEKQLKHMRSDKPKSMYKLKRRKRDLELITMLVDDKINTLEKSFMSFGERS